MFVPSVDGDDSTIGSRDSTSLASGFTAPDGGPITAASLVDLTGPDKCRVKMTQGSVSKVCGHVIGMCSRANHAAIVKDPSRRGEPGWYVGVTTRKGVVDGNLEERRFSTEEVRALQTQELQEHAAAIADLGDPTQSPGTSLHVEFNPTVQEAPPPPRASETLTPHIRNSGAGGLNQGGGTAGPDPRPFFADPPRPPADGVGHPPARPFGGEEVPSTPGATGPGGANPPGRKAPPPQASGPPSTPHAHGTGGNGPPPGGAAPSANGGRTGGDPLRGAPRPTARPTSSGGAPGGGTPNPPTRWYGLEQLNTLARVALTTQEECLFLTTAGWEVRWIFNEQDAATRWVAEAMSPPARAPAGPAPPFQAGAQDRRAPFNPLGAPMGLPKVADAGHGAQEQVWFGMELPQHGGRTLARNRYEVAVLKDNGFLVRELFYDFADGAKWREASKGPTGRQAYPLGQHVRKTGPDPSTTLSEIFGVNMNRFDLMDQMLLPANTPKDMAEDYYDCAADVMALPGGYHYGEREDDAEDDTMVAALSAIARGQNRVGIHSRYQALKMNGLRRLKTRDDLPDFIDRVVETYESAEATMVAQFTRKMHAAGHGEESIQDYLQNGLLPRIVRDTYRFYTSFLTALAGYIHKAGPTQIWADSVPKLLLDYHTDKLGLKRQTSFTYRDHVLMAYTYMRNQQRTTFWNDSLSKKAAVLTSSLLNRATLGARNASSTPAPTSDPPAPRCSTCNRAHANVGSPCPSSNLTAAERTSLSTGLNKRQYEKALKRLKKAFADNPDVEHAEAIRVAREAAQQG